MLFPFKRTLVVGGRYNIYNLDNLTITESDHVQYLITNNSTNKNHLRGDAEDYFFIYRNLFPWNAVLDDLVVGRPAYDNYLVAIAAMTNVAVVDASCSIGALHQMDKHGTKSGLKNNDSNINSKILGRFPYHSGILTKTQYYTTVSKHMILMNTDTRYVKPTLWHLPGKLAPPNRDKTFLGKLWSWATKLVRPTKTKKQ